MTTNQITTTTAPRTIKNPPAWEVLAAVRQPMALPVPPVMAAQRAGDADYDWVLERTHDGEQAAAAYHLAYQRIARMPGGCGPVCGCEMCLSEFGPGDEMTAKPKAADEVR